MDNYNDQADLALLLQQLDNFPHYEGYKPLRVETKVIRLLRIWHESDGEIHATILHASLDAQIEYEALSYCWGPPSIPKKIYIGNEALLIRSNLYEFLAVLCQNKQSLPVWVDSICINQRDVRERNWQVSIMSDIYRGAARVKSWIGPSDAYSDYVFTYTKYHRCEAFRSSNNFASARKTASDSLRTVLDRPYWKRLWIIQEMALAKDLVISCGNGIMRWGDFSDAFEKDLSVHNVMGALSELRQDFAAGVTTASASDIPDMWDELTSSSRALTVPSSSLIAQISRFGGQLCEDDMDRIFALLSLVSNGDQIVVDYSKPLADLLMEVVQMTYHTSVESRNKRALERQNAESELRSDRPVDAEELQDWYDFLDIIRQHIVSGTTLLTRPESLLHSLSDTGNHYVLSLRLNELNLDSFLHRSAPRERGDGLHPGLTLFTYDRDKWIFLAGWCTALRVYGSALLVHWESHSVAPRAIGCFSRRKNLYTLGDDLLGTGIYSALIQYGEIQFCSQAYISPEMKSRRWDALPSGTASMCEFSLHVSSFAILMLVCCASELYPKGRHAEEIRNCLRNRRAKYPLPKLCSCEVSEKANVRAFDSYEKDLVRLWERIWLPEAMDEEDRNGS